MAYKAPPFPPPINVQACVAVVNGLNTERRVKEEIKKLLRKYNAHYIMPVQNGMGTPALDFHCCVNGKYLAIEAKSPGKEATPRQRNSLREIREARGETIVVDGPDRLVELEVVLIALSS